jgi:hypothetical protein
MLVEPPKSCAKSIDEREFQPSGPRVTGVYEWVLTRTLMVLFALKTVCPYRVNVAGCVAIVLDLERAV